MTAEEERENAWLRAHLDARKGFSDWELGDTEVWRRKIARRTVEWGRGERGKEFGGEMVHDLYSPDGYGTSFGHYQLTYNIEKKRGGVRKEGGKEFLVHLIDPYGTEDDVQVWGRSGIHSPYDSLSMALTIMLQHYNNNRLKCFLPQTTESLIDEELER